MADVLVTTLIIDASQATQGAQEYERATQRIEQSSTRATASVDRLGQSVDRAGKTMREATGHGTAFAGAPQNLSGSATNAARATEEYNNRLRETSRLSQSGAFNPIEDTAQFARIKAERQLAEMARRQVGFPATQLGQSVAPFVAPAVTTEAARPFVDASLDALKGNPRYTQTIRQAEQIQKNDPIARQTREEIRDEPRVSGIAAAAEHGAGASSLAEDAALAPVVRELSAAVDRHAAVTSRIEAGRTAPQPPNVAPAGWTSVGRVAGDQGLGVLPNLTPSQLLAAQNNSLPKALAQYSTGPTAVGFDAAAFLQTRQPKPPPNAVNAEEFNKARQGAFNMGAFLDTRAAPVAPNAVDVEAWNKVREGPTGFLASLKALFTGARSGAGDLRAASGATEELAGSLNHAAGAGGRVREAFVILRELSVGNFTRLIGSATIELQRFGKLDLLLNPLVLGIGAVGGALGYLAYKASEVDANLRSFSSTVKVMGDGGRTSAAELEKFTEELKHTGVSGEAAKQTITEISRSGFVKPGQSTQEFAGLARDISQYNGSGAEGTPAAAEELIKAFSGGVDGAVKFANSLHALSGPQIAAIHDLDQHARSGEAFATVYAAIRTAIPPFIGDLSEIQKAFLGVRTEWDKFTTDLAKGEFPSMVTSFIQAGIKELQTTIHELEGVFRAIRAAKNFVAGPAGRETPENSLTALFPEHGPGSGNTEPYAKEAIPPRQAGPAAPRAEPAIPGTAVASATATEEQVLGMVKKAEGASVGPYALHYPAPGQSTQVSSLSDVERARVTRNSHAFGDYGFEPSTYRDAAKATGMNPEDISEKAQHDNALYMLRTYGANSTHTWYESGARLGRPFPEVAQTPFRARDPESAQIEIATQKIKDQLAVSSQLAGVEREAAEARKEFEKQASEQQPFASQESRDKLVDTEMLGFWQNKAALFGAQHRLNEIEISDTDRIAQGYRKSAVEGLRAETLVQAQKEIRERGGAPGEVGPAQRDIIGQRAASAISTSREQSILEEPRIAASERLARASLISRTEEEKARVEGEAAVRTQNVLNLALLQGSEAYIKEAAAIDASARAQIHREDAAAQGLEAGHQIQANRNQTQVLGLELSSVGQGSNEVRAQVDLLRARQEIEQRYTALSQGKRDAIYANAAGVIQLNEQLAGSEQHQGRINELFHGIANTVDGELGNALKNALIRTPLEAGEHIKNYWRDLRTSLKSTLADIVSSIAETAFIKPVTSTIAGSLGLGQVAQQIGGFATGGDVIVGGSGGTDSQNVEFMATPGERVIVLTPAQSNRLDKTGELPHFAGGGELDPGTGEAVYYGGALESRRARAARRGVEHSLSGDDRTWNGIMTAMLPSGFAMRSEDAAVGSYGYGYGQYDPALGRVTNGEDWLGYVKAVPGAVGTIAREAAYGPEYVEETGKRAYENPLPVSDIGRFETQGTVGRQTAATLDDPYAVPPDESAAIIAQLPQFAGGGTYDPATGRTQYFNDAGQPFALPGDRTTPDAPVRDGFFGALPALANAGLKDYGEFVSGAKTYGQPILGFDREKMEFTGRLPVLGDFLAANVIDAQTGTKLTAQTLRELHVNKDLQGKLADRMAAYGGLYETGENAPQPALENSAGEPEARAAIPEAQAAIPPPLPPGSAMLEPAYSGLFDVLPALAEGGSIVQTGAALVHAGELVLPTEKTDDALRSVTAGLQGFSTVLGQATPGLQTLGRAASELGALGNIAHAVGNFVLPSANASPIGGGLGNGGLNNSQLTFNVSGIAPGATITGPAQGGTINSTGNVMTAIGGAAPAVTPPEPTAAPTASAGLGSIIKAAAGTSPRIVENAQPASSGGGTTIIDLGPADFSSGSLSSQPASSSSTGGQTVIDVQGPADFSSASLAPQEPSALSSAAATQAGIPQREQQATTPPTPASTSPINASTLSTVSSGLSLIDKLNGNLPGFLPSFLQDGSGSGVGSFLSNPFGLFATSGGPGAAIQGAPTVIGTPGLFGTTATFGSVLAGAGAGFGAGMLLNNALGGNPTGGTVGSAGGALAGALIGSLVFPGVGTFLGGLIGGGAGGGLGGLVGGHPSGQSAGAAVGANGQIAFEDAGGSQQNITASSQVAEQIGSFTRGLSQLTDAFGNAIGTVSSDAVVSSDNRKGLSVTGGNISGGTFGQNADEAVKETELQLIHSLANVTSDTLRTIFKNINDPSQLQNAVQFAAVYDRLNVTSAQLTASLNGNVNAVGPFQQALTQVKSTFTQLTSQAQQFGLSTAPITQALQTVTDTLNADFRINVAEALSTAIDGGNDFIASLVKIHQTYVQAASDAQSLSGVPAPVLPPGFADGGTTPAGWILVGEKGPEWMYQPGGATVLPNGIQPSDVPSPDGRSFAQGTIGPGDVAGQVPGVASYISQASGGPSLLDAAGSVLGIGSDTLSTIGSVLPVAPIIGGVVGLATGGNPLSSGISIATSLAALALANPLIGVVGGLVALVSSLFGPKPSNRASGDVIDLASGTVSGFQSAGDSKADQEVQQVSEGISRITTSFQQATGGTLSGSLSVQDGIRDGLKTSYSGPLGHIDAKWGSVSDAIGQFGLAIAHNLQGIDPTLQAQLAGINDPNALIPAIEQFTGKSIDLSSSTPVAGPSAAGTDQSQAPAAASAASPATSGDAGAPAAPAAAPSAPGVVWAAPTTDPALLKIFPQLGVGPTVFSDAGAVPGFANGGTTPPGWILVGERGPEWMFQAGAATVLPNGVQPADVPSLAGRSFADGTQDWGSFELTVPAGWSGVVTTDPATAAQWIKLGAKVSPLGSSSHAGLQDYEVSVLRQAQTAVGGTSSEAQQWSSSGATVTTLSAPVPDAPAAASTPSGAPNGTIAGTPVGQIYQAIAGTEVAQAAPVLAGLGSDQLTTVVQQLGQVAPEIATMAQNLINSGNALPDLITQGIEALTDPLEIAIQKEKALGAERVAAAAATGQDLVKVEQLNSANLVQAVLNNLSNQNALNALTYPGNTKALEYLQAAPALAQLSGQQLGALKSNIGDVAPDLAALAQDFIDTGTALPDTITQALQGIVSPLQLAIEQQRAQAEGRTQVANVTGQDQNTVAALNSASIMQAVLGEINNPTALAALVANGNPKGLAQLQAGPVLAGLGTDQLQALVTALGSAAPDITAMVNALVQSGRALPTALKQADEAITSAGLLAVQKASALGFEQVQGAAATGQSVPDAQKLAADEVAAAIAQATNTQLPVNGLPDWISQIEEAATAPLQLAIQKEQAAGAERVAIAQATGADLARVEKANADAVAQAWYQATAQLTSLKNDITSGSLSGLTPANQVPAAVEQFNQLLKLVQGGNTNFISELAQAGTAAVQAAQTAYGNGPQTASVREQVLGAVQPFLVSQSGFPTSGPTSITGGATVLPSAGSDLQQNTSALQNLTSAITGSPILGPGNSPGGTAVSSTAASGTSATGVTTNPVTGQSFTGSGITSVVPNFPLYPSASSLSNALSDAVAGRAQSQDWATINQALQAGILDPTKQPGYALVIEQAQQWAAGQAINPSAGLQQALSDATHGTPSLQEWALINQAVNSGILDPTSSPQYSLIIQQARKVANAQATSLSQIPNNQTAYFTAINGLPAFASGTDTTPPGLIMVGEKGPEWYRAANDNAAWSIVGSQGPEVLNQSGGATIIPFPHFAEGTPDYRAGRYAWAEGDGGASDKVAAMLEKLRGELVLELQANRKQLMGGQVAASSDAAKQHALTRQVVTVIGPAIKAPERRAVG